MKSRTQGAGVAGALALLALAGCGHSSDTPASSSPAAKPPAGAAEFRPGNVSFGVLAPLTGPDAARGKDLVDGAKLAMADLNVRGGVLGQKVALVTYDDRCDAAGSRAGAESLKGSEIAGAVGGICAGAASAAARTLGSGLPFLVTSANAPSIVSAKRTPTAYLTNGTPYQSALAAVHWLAFARSQKLAVVSEEDRASKHLAEQVLGLSSPVPKPVSRQSVPAGTTDWGTIVKSALAGEPDTIYWAGSAEGGGHFRAALTDAGYTGAFVASAQSESPAFLAAAGPSAEGAYVIAPATPQNLPEAAGWAKRFETRFKHAPGFDALQAYDGVRALAQAVTQSGKVDAERNSRELELLNEDYTTFLGDTGLSFASDHTIKYDNNIVLKVAGGKFAVENTLRSNAGG